MWSREQKTLVGDTALETHILSPFLTDPVMLGQSLSISVLNQHKDISLGARLLHILQTHQRAPSSSPGGTGEDAVSGKQNSLQPASYRPGSSSCATGNPEERGGSSPASPNDLHWCQGVFASAQFLQPGAFLGLPQPSPLPNLTRGSPAGKGIPWPPLHQVSWKT